MALLDLSAAFDTVGLTNLINRLSSCHPLGEWTNGLKVTCEKDVSPRYMLIYCHRWFYLNTVFRRAPSWDRYYSSCTLQALHA